MLQDEHNEVQEFDSTVNEHCSDAHNTGKRGDNSACATCGGQGTAARMCQTGGDCIVPVCVRNINVLIILDHINV